MDMILCSEMYMLLSKYQMLQKIKWYENCIVKLKHVT